MILKPKIKLERVTDISVELLKKYNIKALILDVDNTLSTHHGQVLTDGLPEWLSYMKENEIKLMVLSNSKKKRVEPFANKIDLDFISLGLKPLPFGYLRAIRALSVKKKNAAIVGDQIFTDVLGGNALGIKTILLTPIKEEKMWSFRVRRSIEKKLFKKWQLKNTEV
ncbi:MAG: YqeG family HAD IIIA-type phosphatase [Clostridia bacterium]|nr:YqeG family HAD IIIA-type phosphatase [Clostridia bacterium]